MYSNDIKGSDGLSNGSKTSSKKSNFNDDFCISKEMVPKIILENSKQNLNSDPSTYNTFETYIYKTQDNDYMAGIKVSYKFHDLDDLLSNENDLHENEVYISMQPKKDGNAQFIYEPPNNILSNTKTFTSSNVIYGALKAIEDYIRKNENKKYGRFFGLYRNSNSFVKKITKSVPGLKEASKMHSAFTAKGAKNTIDQRYSMEEVTPGAPESHPDFELNNYRSRKRSLRSKLVNGGLNLLSLLFTKSIEIESLSEQNRLYGCSLKDILEDHHKHQASCPYESGYLYQLMHCGFIKKEDLITVEKYGFTLEDAVKRGWIDKNNLSKIMNSKSENPKS